MDYRVKLSIAGIVVEARSSFPCADVLAGLKSSSLFRNYQRFECRGNRAASIKVSVDVTGKAIAPPRRKPFFICTHPDGDEVWRLYKHGGGYLFFSSIPEKKQLISINRKFDRAHALVAAKDSDDDFPGPLRAVAQKHGSFVWKISDIIYDFLQVLLINYLALNDGGIIAHAAGIKCAARSGFLFCGKSGAGKSTTAGLWAAHEPGAVILNDDRVVITRGRNGFVMHSSPWAGSFQGYVPSSSAAAPLRKLFFIYHAQKNILRRISSKEAFNCFFPSIFPVFWDRQLLNKCAFFIHEMVERVPCYRLGFVKKSSVVNFVKNIP